MSEYNNRLDRLEKQVKIIQTIMKETKMVENDFDFDNLLNEIDTIEETTQETEVPAEITPEPQETVDEIDSLLDAEPEQVAKTADTVIEDIEAQEEALKQQKKVAQEVKSEAIADKVQIDYEYAEEARAFLKAHDALENEKKDIIERMKELKEEYQDAGVEVKTVLKAQKEIIKEIKETPDEAHLVEQMKEMIRQDEILMGQATLQAG